MEFNLIRPFPLADRQEPKPSEINASPTSDSITEATPTFSPVHFGATAPPATVSNNDDYSIWRDTALRYGGYADEVGEFLSPYLGGLGKFLGYGISSLYCMADMGTTLPKKFKNAPPEMSTGEKTRKTAAEGLDLSMFHLVATLLIPPKIIGATVQSAERILDKEALMEAEEALKKEGLEAQNGSVMKQFSHWLSKQKLAGEKALNDIVNPMMEGALQWGEKGEHLASAEKLTNQFLQKCGPKLSGFVSVNAKLAEFYNTVMPFDYLKDSDMHKNLAKNAESLESGKAKLSRAEVAKLLLMKPLPVMVGIGMVPLIAHPFDKLMLKVQDWTIRPFLGKNKLQRGADGKLHSVRNPAFWGDKGATPSTHKSFSPFHAASSTAWQSPYPRRTYHPIPLMYRGVQPNHPFHANPYLAGQPSKFYPY